MPRKWAVGVVACLDGTVTRNAEGELDLLETALGFKRKQIGVAV